MQIQCVELTDNTPTNKQLLPHYTWKQVFARTTLLLDPYFLAPQKVFYFDLQLLLGFQHGNPLGGTRSSYGTYMMVQTVVLCRKK